MSHIINFLIARIREDEILAHTAVRGPEDGNTSHWDATTSGMHGTVETAGGQAVAAFSDMDEGTEDEALIAAPLDTDVASYIAWFDPSRILSECRAKRLLILIHEEHDGGNCSTLYALAQAYSDRRDFPSGWRGPAPSRTIPASQPCPHSVAVMGELSHLWQEVDDLARTRLGDYDTRALVKEIDATFGPSSLRELPDNEIERLLLKHKTSA